MTTSPRTTHARAILVERFGGPEELTVRDIELAAPAHGEVLVRLAVSGVNFVDIYRRRGLQPVQLPFIPGMEGAGVVEAVGPGVTSAKPGDRVAYAREPGSYAEASVVPADSLIPLPDDMPFEQAAAFPMQGLTAHYLIHEFRRPAPGDVVLVHAAAGGVGLVLVQWARHYGAHVIGTVSTESKAEAARQAGADDVIVYTEKDFPVETMCLTNGHGADLIIDGVGAATVTRDLEAAALHGHIVTFGAASGPADAIRPSALMGRSLSLSGADVVNGMRTRAEMLARACDVIEGITDGWLTPRICAVLPLADAAEAHRLLEGRQTIGKILLSQAAPHRSSLRSWG
jgi:NADPH2:quinone reductase